MKYMGSKARVAKEIMPFLNSSNGFYYEPFAGGMNMVAAYDHTGVKRFANDSNRYLIAMFKALQSGWVPDDYYEKDFYKFVQKTFAVPDHMIGWLGFNCSYSGKWFGGCFAGIVQTRGGVRNYQTEAKRNVMNQILNLSDVSFSCKPYDEMVFVKGSTVYCDPPYEGTTGYKDGGFDHSKFWEWVREVSVDCKVLVSEYNAPDDFTPVWSKPVKSSLSANGSVGGNKTSVEKLFVHSRHSQMIASVIERA